MDCPTCNSKSTKKLSMVYAQGTRNYNSRTSGSSVSSRGTLSGRSGSRASSSQSALAAAAAPPMPSRIPKIVALILTIIFILPSFTFAFSTTQDISIWARILAILTLIVFSAATYFIYKFLSKSHEKRKADWDRAWICLRCGGVYDPLS